MLHVCSEALREAAYNEAYDIQGCGAASDARLGCAPGFYAPTSTSLEAIPCKDGYWCPDRFDCMIECVKGAICLPAELDARNTTCQPDQYPPLRNESGQLWCGGSASELKCPAGLVCPTPREKYACAAGLYCREGSFYAKECPFLASCPAGAVVPRSYAGIMVLVFAVVLIMIRVVHQKVRERQRRIARDRQRMQHVETRTPLEEVLSSVQSRAAVILRRLSHTSRHRSSSEYLHQDAKRRAASAYATAVEKERLREEGASKEVIEALEWRPLTRRQRVSRIQQERREEEEERPLDGVVQISPLYELERGEMGRNGGPEVQRREEEEEEEEDVLDRVYLKPPKRLTATWACCWRAYKKHILQREEDRQEERWDMVFPIEVSFEDLVVTLPNGRKALDGVTGKLRPGQMTAVMGPSGSGKTTFLSALSGQLTAHMVQGNVELNGTKGTLSDVRTEVGYVPQEDTLLSELTVLDTLRFYAAARLPANATVDDRERVVASAVEALGLQDILDENVGEPGARGISGGQKKRTSVGAELVACPSLLCLDEPSSGLDASSGLQLLRMLCDVARKNVNIVAVIHQPRYEAFCLFTHLMLLGTKGRLVYFGPSMAAQPYFEALGYRVPPEANPADVFLDIVAGLVVIQSPASELQDKLDSILGRSSLQIPSTWSGDVDELANIWKTIGSRWVEIWNEFGRPTSIATFLDTASPLPSTHFLAAAPAPPNPPIQSTLRRREPLPFMGQLGLFFTRSLRQEYARVGFLIDLVLTVLVGFALGIVFQQPELSEWPGMALLVALAAGLTTIVASLRAFGGEQLVAAREQRMGLSLEAYFLGKALARFPYVAAAPGLFLTLFYTLVQPYIQVTTFYSLFFAASWATCAIGYILSVLFATSNAQLAGVVIGMIAAMAGGVVPTLREQTAAGYGGAMQMSFARFMIEALFVSETSRWPPVWQREIESLTNLYGFETPAAYVRSRAYAAMWTMGILLHLVAYAALYIRHRVRIPHWRTILETKCI